MLANDDKPRCVLCHASYARGERFCPLDGGAIVADTADPLVGKTIDGRYLVRRFIGRGGMGAVYEADHIGLDKRVAIKLISTADADRDQRARFRQEARAASKIVHEHVVQIFDVGADGDSGEYIAMEYVAGRDLQTVLHDGPLEPARAIAIASQMLRGLHASHELGIIHRDIKPPNVMLTGPDETIVKVMDFGIAKSIHAHVAQTDTGTGRVIGTPQYMAPEQLADAAIDRRTDLYAVGATLYAMLTGDSPFAGTSFTQRIEALARPAPSLDLRRPGLPVALVAAIERALARSPEDRFPDALAFIAALDAIDAGVAPPPREPASSREAPTVAVRSGRRPADARPARARWWWLAVPIVAAGIGITVYATRGSPDSAKVAPAPSPPGPVAAVAADAAITVDEPPVVVVAAVDAGVPDAAGHATIAKPIAPPQPETGPRCECQIENAAGTSNACKQRLRTPTCACIDAERYDLCPVALTVTSSDYTPMPDGSKQGTFYCIDRARADCTPRGDLPASCTIWRTTGGTTGGACHGFGQGQRPADAPRAGTFDCDFCDWQIHFHGQAGAPCTGFSGTDGQRYTGVLGLCAAK